MSQVDVAEPVAVPETLSNSMIVKDVLRFAFQGYAIWLEAEQFPISNNNNKNNDLDQVIRTASHELNVFPIPVLHLTMLYGISHLSEREVRKRFQDLALQLQEEDSPLLQPDGFLSDTEIDGINGGGMNMAWIETSFKTSIDLERLIDQTFECFYGENGETRNGPWSPHISLAYDNEECPIPAEYLHTLVQRFPTLTLPRKARSVSLWDLNGTIDQWKLVDRFPLDLKTSSFG